MLEGAGGGDRSVGFSRSRGIFRDAAASFRQRGVVSRSPGASPDPMAAAATAEAAGGGRAIGKFAQGAENPVGYRTTFRAAPAQRGRRRGSDDRARAQSPSRRAGGSGRRRLDDMPAVSAWLDGRRKRPGRRRRSVGRAGRRRSSPWPPALLRRRSPWTGSRFFGRAQGVAPAGRRFRRGGVEAKGKPGQFSRPGGQARRAHERAAALRPPRSAAARLLDPPRGSRQWPA